MPDAIGFIGLGRMGMPMSRRLMAAGRRVVVHNRSRAKVDALVAEGAIGASSVAEVVRSCGIVLTCLDSVASTETVYLGEDGLAAQAPAGMLLVDHGTIAPELVRRIASAATARGAGFLDAPVSGGPEGSAKGGLAIMVGGGDEDFARGLPVMQAYGATIVHMGASGAGTRAKLVNQLLTFVHGAAAAEAIAMAQRLGLDLESLATVLRAGFGQSRMLDRTLDRVQRDDYAAGAALSLFAKDIGLARALGESLGMALPVLHAAGEIVEGAVASGHGGEDLAALRRRYPG